MRLATSYIAPSCSKTRSLDCRSDARRRSINLSLHDALEFRTARVFCGARAPIQSASGRCLLRCKNALEAPVSKFFIQIFISHLFVADTQYLVWKMFTNLFMENAYIYFISSSCIPFYLFVGLNAVYPRCRPSTNCL